MDKEVSEKIFIEERKYQKIKKILHKQDNYFSKKELKNLMQLLTRSQQKSVKNKESPHRGRPKIF